MKATVKYATKWLEIRKNDNPLNSQEEADVIEKLKTGELECVMDERVIMDEGGYYIYRVVEMHSESEWEFEKD